jgi:hypothetical protein
MTCQSGALPALAKTLGSNGPGLPQVATAMSLGDHAPVASRNPVLESVAVLRLWPSSYSLLASLQVVHETN